MFSVQDIRNANLKFDIKPLQKDAIVGWSPKKFSAEVLNKYWIQAVEQVNKRDEFSYIEKIKRPTFF